MYVHRKTCIAMFLEPYSFRLFTMLLISAIQQSDSVIHTCVHAKLLQSCRVFVNPWTVACQAPLFMGFSRQEYWSGLPCPPPGDLPDPGTEPLSQASSALADGFFTTSATREIPTSITEASASLNSMTWSIAPRGKGHWGTVLQLFPSFLASRDTAFPTVLPHL